MNPGQCLNAGVSESWSAWKKSHFTLWARSWCTRPKNVELSSIPFYDIYMHDFNWVVCGKDLDHRMSGNARVDSLVIPFGHLPAKELGLYDLINLFTNFAMSEFIPGRFTIKLWVFFQFYHTYLWWSIKWFVVHLVDIEPQHGCIY